MNQILRLLYRPLYAVFPVAALQDLAARLCGAAGGSIPAPGTPAFLGGQLRRDPTDPRQVPVAPEAILSH